MDTCPFPVDEDGFIHCDDSEDEDNWDENVSMKFNGRVMLIGKGGCMVQLVEDPDITQYLIELLTDKTS